MMKMKMNWRSRSCLLFGIVLFLSTVQAQYIPSAEPPVDPFAPYFSWSSTAGVNQRHSNTSLFDGPTTPAIRWIAPGGLTAEVAHFGPHPFDPAGFLIAPQNPAFGSVRVGRYSFFLCSVGEPLGAFGPFWGRLTAATIFNTAVYVFREGDVLDVEEEEGEQPPARTLTNWPVFVFAGGQYDCIIYSPSPFPPQRQIPDLNINIGDLRSHGIPVRRIAAQKTHIGTYTDGLLTYALISDMVLWDDQIGAIPNPVAVGVFWIDSPRGAGPVVVIDYLSFSGAASAALGPSVFNEYNDSGFIGFHNGDIFVYNLTTIPEPTFANFYNIVDLSQEDREPLTSDSVDRPIVFNEDNTLAFICASNNGRVYAVDALTGDRVWGTRLNLARPIPIMAGPALGRDALTTETLYIVGRTASNRCTLFAINADNGEIKWQFALPNISRCTPLVDPRGWIYMGDERGILYAIEDTGTEPRLRWRLNLGAPISVSPTIVLDFLGSPLLIVGASNRYIFAIEDRNLIEFPSGSTGIGMGSP